MRGGKDGTREGRTETVRKEGRVEGRMEERTRRGQREEGEGCRDRGGLEPGRKAQTEIENCKCNISQQETGPQVLHRHIFTGIQELSYSDNLDPLIMLKLN